MYCINYMQINILPQNRSSIYLLYQRNNYAEPSYLDIVINKFPNFNCKAPWSHSLEGQVQGSSLFISALSSQSCFKGL